MLRKLAFGLVAAAAISAAAFTRPLLLHITSAWAAASAAAGVITWGFHRFGFGFGGPAMTVLRAAPRVPRPVRLVNVCY